MKCNTTENTKDRLCKTQRFSYVKHYQGNFMKLCSYFPFKHFSENLT